MSDSESWVTVYTDRTCQTMISRSWLRYLGEDVGFEDREVIDPENWEVISESEGEQKSDHFLIISTVRRR